MAMRSSPLHDDLHGAVGHAQQPRDAGHRADAKDIVRAALLDIGIALRHQTNQAITAHDVVDQLDRALLADAERDDGKGKDHQPAQRHDGQDIGNIWHRLPLIIPVFFQNLLDSRAEYFASCSCSSATRYLLSAQTLPVTPSSLIDGYTGCRSLGGFARCEFAIDAINCFSRLYPQLFRGFLGRPNVGSHRHTALRRHRA